MEYLNAPKRVPVAINLDHKPYTCDCDGDGYGDGEYVYD